MPTAVTYTQLLQHMRSGNSIKIANNGAALCLLTNIARKYTAPHGSDSIRFTNVLGRGVYVCSIRQLCVLTQLPTLSAVRIRPQECAKEVWGVRMPFHITKQEFQYPRNCASLQFVTAQYCTWRGLGDGICLKRAVGDARSTVIFGGAHSSCLCSGQPAGSSPISGGGWFFFPALGCCVHAWAPLTIFAPKKLF